MNGEWRRVVGGWLKKGWKVVGRYKSSKKIDNPGVQHLPITKKHTPTNLS